MNQLKNSPLHGSVVALALSAGALLGSLLLRPYLEHTIFLLFLVAVCVSAWFYGRAGGFTATATSVFAIFYFFLKDDGAAPSWSAAARLLTFLAMALFFTWVIANWREGRRILASTLSSIADAVIAIDHEGRITFMNTVAESLTGWSHNDARHRHSSEVLKLKKERTEEELENPLTTALRDRVTVSAGEHTFLVTRSGSEIPIEHSASPVRDGTGGIRGAILVFRDITKRRHLEEQASHAQKMDAVGRLAGGVAGDFNNVLTVITGYAELLRAELPAASPQHRFCDEIIYAAERAASLTHHLLAFSRGATSQPRVLDPNALVKNMEPMLRRLLGQNIELILLTSTSTGRVKVDGSQFEQVIVNLVTNARDAMPNGGKVVIETANVDVDDSPAGKNLGVKPGAYAMIAVSDTGIGMDNETRSRLFEPFFTTKAPGKGSGLGLATAYGIIKQSDGQVTVYSQPNCGTIFEIYLPRVHEAVTEAPRGRSGKGSETILLVDDEEGVRRLVYAVLKSNGYDVLEANNGVAALTAYEKNSHKIDMVLTDVVMPQMTGFELGRQLADRSPDLKILYMSGYRDTPIGNPGVEPPRAFLHKPFTPDALLSKVRDVLDNGGPR